MAKKNAAWEGPRCNQMGADSISAPALHEKLGDGKTNDAFEALDLGWIKIFFSAESLFGAADGFFGRVFVDFFFRHRAFRQYRNRVGNDLGKAFSDGEVQRRSVFRDAQLSIFHLSEERNVAGKNADFALDGGDHDGVDRVAVNPRFGGDDFKCEWHAFEAEVGKVEF
jgi:hypothetical protein